MEGNELPAVSNSSHALRLHVTIGSMLESQPARLWASGSTQQRGDYHTNLFKYSVSGISPSRYQFSSCTFQQGPYNSAIFASLLQFLFYHMGQERINCCELIKQCGWMEKGNLMRGRTGTSTSNSIAKENSGPSCASDPSDRGRQVVTGTLQGQCASLWRPFTTLLLHLQRCRCHCSPAQGLWPCPAPSLLAHCLLASCWRMRKDQSFQLIYLEQQWGLGLHIILWKRFNQSCF